MRNYLGILLVLFSFHCSAQERCGFAMGEKSKQNKNPDWIKQKAEFEYQLRELQKETITNGRNLRVTDKIYKIPVVVHIIHNNTTNFIGGTNNTNISDEQIKSQIRVLNEDYRKKTATNGFNSNPIGADMELEFELATRDPRGNLTNGITRTFINQVSFDLENDNEKIANIIKWDYEKYLNIWVVRSKGGVIGYSEFPYDSNLKGLDSNPTLIAGQNIFDGIIINYTNFGTCCGTLSSSYNLGRTASHEVGHWLGLLHPNGDTNCGEDFCNDTPQIEILNNTTTCTKLVSNCGSVSRTNMIENYMDYSPDRCMNTFTNDQKSRIRSTLLLSNKRKKLLLNTQPIPDTDNLTIRIDPNPINSNGNVLVQFKGQKSVNISIYDTRGILAYEENYDAQNSSFYILKTDFLKSGAYILRVTAGIEVETAHLAIQK